MYIIAEQHPILNRVDGSCGLASRRNGNPLTVVIILPVTFVSERKDVCSLEASPETEFSIDSQFSGNDASTVSLAYRIAERSPTGSGSDRNRTNQPTLVVNDKGTCLKLNKCFTSYGRKPPTFGDDIVFAGLEWLLIPQDIPQAIRHIFMPQNVGAGEKH